MKSIYWTFLGLSFYLAIIEAKSLPSSAVSIGVKSKNGIVLDERKKLLQNYPQHFSETVLNLQAAAESSSIGSSSFSSSVVNLSKTILGAGALSLSYGIASFTASREGIIPGVSLLFLMGLISAYSFYSIGKVCDYYNVNSFSRAWEKTVGPSSKKFLEFILMFKTFFTCLAYSIIIGDSFSQMFQSFRLPSFFWIRNNVIMTAAATILLPLSILRNLDALKYTSFLGLLGIVYCAAFLGIRYFDQSYTPSGQFFQSIAENLRPQFTVSSSSAPLINPNIFLLISMISTAYVCHYNAPKFYADLREKNLRNYAQITKVSFSFAFLMYVLMMSLGFLTFGGHSTGFILNNYANADILATIARIAIGTGIICTYPLTFGALRDTMFDFFNLSPIQRERWYLPMTLTLLGLITTLSLFVNNVGKVVSISGALIGSLLIYIVPMLMNVKMISQIQQMVPEAQDFWKYRVEKQCNYGLIVLGVLMAVIGMKLNMH